MRRLLRALPVVFLVTGLGLPFGSTAAHAAVLDASCVGTQTATYSPGLTLTPAMQSVGANTVYTPCVSPGRPALTAARNTSFARQSLSCLDVDQTGSGSKIIVWNTGEISAFAFNRTVSHLAGTAVVTLTGAITAGVFAGDTAVEVITGPSLDILACFMPPGITGRAGATVLTISGR